MVRQMSDGNDELDLLVEGDGADGVDVGIVCNGVIYKTM